MAWHILHGLLEQVRTQSTFPGKLWIVTMFVFRIVVVARIGDNVYEDEQSSFICNTLTPGCTNVCFNRFSPISQLRFWSLMVLVVSTPSILFFLYAVHEIYNAGIKYPDQKKEQNSTMTSHAAMTTQTRMTLQSTTAPPYLPSTKRQRGSTETVFNGSVTSPLYVVTKMSKNEEKPGWRKFLRKRRHPSRDKEETNKVKKSISDNNENEMRFYTRNKYPIYTDAHCRQIEFIEEENQTTPENIAIEERKLRARMMEHPELARAYWWHVLLRTVCEVGFLFGQYYLYGISVPELYECQFWPCPKSVDCFVSRPQEKTCLLWLMYGLGAIACIFSAAEFWTLGVERVKIAFLCCSGEETYEERKRRLAMLEPPKPTKSSRGGAHKHQLTAAISMESISSETTVESV